MTSLKVVIIEKNGSLRNLSIKEFKVSELYRKCGFKKGDNFINHCNWDIEYEQTVYKIAMFGKNEGRSNNENKYEFPPPIDSKLFFGSCVLVASLNDTYVNLTTDIWSSMYNKLYGGFEDLSATIKEDNQEEDELDNIPDKYKTKHGYLKDGFIVDSNSDDESSNATNYFEDLDPELTEDLYIDIDANI